MYSFSDMYPVLLDNSGSPLVGKLVFLDASTLSPRSVYTKNGTELDSTQYVNGATSQQIFLKGSYRVDVYKTIGNDDFLLQRTFLISSIQVPSVLPEDTLTGISALKEYDTTSLDDGFAVRVFGYYTSNDCPVRTYVWRKDSTEDSDGGMVIKGNSETGRWILLNPYPYIDVRWYGDIPQSSSTGVSYDSQRKLAQYASNKNGKSLYFGINDNSSKFYIFSGSDYGVLGDIIVDHKARFVVNLSSASSNITIQASNIIHPSCDLMVQIKGSYKLSAHCLRTSWYSKGYAYSEVTWNTNTLYVVDSTRINQFVNCDIVVEKGTEIGNLILDNVRVLRGDHFISSTCNISNCDGVSDKWFENGTDYSHNIYLSNNKLHIADFEDKLNYFVFKNLQSESDYGDLEGNTISNSTIRSNATLHNGTLVNAILKGALTAKDATISVSSNSNSSSRLVLDNVVLSCFVDIDKITAKNSEINLGNSTHTYSNIDLTNCTFKHTNGIYVNELVLDSCVCDGHTIYVNASATDGIYKWKVVNSKDVAITENSSTTTLEKTKRNCVCYNNRNFSLNDTDSKVSKFSDESDWTFEQGWTKVKLSFEGNEIRSKFSIDYPALGGAKILYEVPVTGDVRNYLVVNVKPDFVLPYSSPQDYIMDFRFELKSGEEYYLTSTHSMNYADTRGTFKQIVGSFAYLSSITDATCLMYYRLRK